MWGMKEILTESALQVTIEKFQPKTEEMKRHQVFENPSKAILRTVGKSQSDNCAITV